MNQALETLEPTDRAAKRVMMGDDVIYNAKIEGHCPAKVQTVGTDGYCLLCVFGRGGPYMTDYVPQGDARGQWNWPPPRA